MARQVTIANAHSKNVPGTRIIFEMQGGSPWYVDLWLNDELHTLYYDDGTEQFELEKRD